MTYHIDGTVNVTPAQRATIERCGLAVTEEFGHVVVRDELVLRQFGKSQGKREGMINDADKGRVHGPLNTIENMVEQMAYMHDLAAQESGGKRTPAADSAHPGPRTTVPRAKRTSALAAQAAHNAAVAAVVPKAQGAPVPVVTNPAAHRESGFPQGGVIGNLIGLLSDGTARTRDELYTALIALFPDRATAVGGMRVTIGVQLGALRKKGHNIVADADKRYSIPAAK
jgi:hypothetical protein